MTRYYVDTATGAWGDADDVMIVELVNVPAPGQYSGDARWFENLSDDERIEKARELGQRAVSE